MVTYIHVTCVSIVHKYQAVFMLMYFLEYTDVFYTKLSMQSEQNSQADSRMSICINGNIKHTTEITGNAHCQSELQSYADEIRLNPTSE